MKVGHLFWPEIWWLQVSLVAWIVITVVQLWGNLLIRNEVKYGVISYKFLKTLTAAIFGFIATSTILGERGGMAYALGFTGVALIMTILDFLHIVRRNHAKSFLTGKTTVGIVNFEDAEEVELILSSAASIIRHQRLDNKQYAKQRSIEEVLEAFGIPSQDEWLESLREEARLLREKRAKDGVFAADVEMLRKEING
jgi:hypothetical protein